MNGPFAKVGMFAGLAAGLTLPASAGTTTYQIDPRHSSAGFGVTHLMISTVRGEFHGVTGTVIVDDTDISKSSVNVTIDATTVDTREPDSDKHLKSEAFFDVAKYPTITFQSTKVERNCSQSAHQGSLGFAAHRRIRFHEDQPAGLRRGLEPEARQRRRGGRR